MTPLRIGVVGLAFGEHHLRTLVNMTEYRIVAVADHDVERARRIAGEYGVSAYRDGEEMVDKEELDALSVSVAPRARRAILEAASSRKLPMFVEKPWASSYRQGIELSEICRRSSAPVMVAFSFRFHPVIERLRALREERLGRPWLCNGSYVFGWLPPREHWLWDPNNGNGFFNENSGHLLDVVCSLLGTPESVMASGGRFTGSPSEDGAAVVLRFRSGAVAALSLGGIGTAAFSGYPSLEIFFEKGQARLGGRNHIWETLDWAERGEEEIHSIAAPPEALGATRYTHAFRHFAGCVRDGKMPEATMADGVRSVAVAEAIYRSMAEHTETPVADLAQLSGEGA